MDDKVAYFENASCIYNLFALVFIYLLLYVDKYDSRRI
jgi:hypothetical protein